MSTATKPAPETKPPPPVIPWFNELKNLYENGTAHEFLLHWNVADYVAGSLDLRNFIAQVFRHRNIIVYYNRGEGISFPPGPAGEAMKAQFVEALGIGQAANAATAMFNQAGGAGVNLPREPAAAFSLLERALQLPEVLPNKAEFKMALVIDYLETISPAADVAAMSPDDRTALVHLQRWARNQNIAKNGHPIILIANDLVSVHPHLRAASSRIAAVEIPLPDYHQRLDYINSLLTQPDPLRLAEELDAETFARMTSGLARLHLEDIKLSGQNEHRPVDLELVRTSKRRIVSQEFGECLEVIDPGTAPGFDQIGGLEHVKAYLGKVVRKIRTGEHDTVPMGILLLGPAGTGKTLVAKAMAKEAGMGYVELNLAKIFDKYVGGSERNLERALKAIDSMWPTIVFIDELDQSIQRSTGENDSGVGARAFKRILEYMSDTTHRGRVLFIAASNRPEMIDPALKRPGRFDVKVPFLVPEGEDREAIVLVYAKALMGVAQFAKKFAFEVSQATSGWTGAELERLISMAADVLRDPDEAATTPEAAIKAALGYYRPTTQEIGPMTLAALREADDWRLVPTRMRKALEARDDAEKVDPDNPELPPELEVPEPRKPRKREL